MLIVSRHGFTFRKEGYRKIIEYDLPIKQRRQHAAAGRKRPNVMLMTNAQPARESAVADDVDEDESMSDDDGESTHSNPPEALPTDDHPDPDKGPARAADGREKGKRGRNERVVAPEECRAHVRLLYKNEHEICSLLFGRHGPFAPLTREGLSPASADQFFLEVLPVSPTRFRPPVEMGDALFEHPHNELLTRILVTSYRLRDITTDMRAKDAGLSAEASHARHLKILATMLETLIRLQDDVNSFIDSSKNPQPARRGKLPPPGVKQGLEKKEGLFRKHMMVRAYTGLRRRSMFTSYNRANVSTTPRDLSSRQM